MNYVMELNQGADPMLVGKVQAALAKLVPSVLCCGRCGKKLAKRDLPVGHDGPSCVTVGHCGDALACNVRRAGGNARDVAVSRWIGERARAKGPVERVPFVTPGGWQIGSYGLMSLRADGTARTQVAEPKPEPKPVTPQVPAPWSPHGKPVAEPVPAAVAADIDRLATAAWTARADARAGRLAIT